MSLRGERLNAREMQYYYYPLLDTRSNPPRFSPLRSLFCRFVYLTSRPISLMGYTRKYLNSLSQDSHRLPEGATLCHTGSVKDVLVTELIKKDPDKFKADVLRRQVILPFAAAGKSHDDKLFAAGFGNKLTDMRAYSEVGIALRDIYIINKSSNLLQESERAGLEVEAFEAVSKSTGMRNKMRRNSILARLPSDVRSSLGEDEDKETGEEGRAGEGSELVRSVRNSLGELNKIEAEAVQALAEGGPPPSPSKLGSLSPKAVIRKVGKR